jgi:hypothetical protein
VTGESPSEMLDRLCAEHPGWEIRAHPLGLGLWTAEHRSDDGRSIHYIVCHTGDELDARMAEQAREQADRLAGRAMDVIDWAVSEGRLPG